MSRAQKFRLHEVRPVQFLLYLVLRILVMVLSMFPFRMATDLGRLLGWIVRVIDRKHVRIATKNLENSPGVCAPNKIPAFIRKVYRHIGLSFVEMLMTPRILQRRELERHVKLLRFDRITGALKGGKGCILVIGHLGNWEMGGLLVSQGYPIHSLMRPIDNPWMDRYLREFRTLAGQRMIPRDRALGQMIRVLQKNELLIVQVDQDAREAGVFVNFFGRPASTHRAPATLSLKYDAPIVIVNVYREGGVNHAVADDAIFPGAFRDKDDPVKALTQAYTLRLEEFIRQHPEQWFWVHDRWKTAERTARKTSEALV